MEISKLFYNGKFKDVLERSKKHTGSQKFYIGSLAQLGDVHTAEREFLRHQDFLSLEDRVEVHFFLIIGFCRVSEYDQAKIYLIKNLYSQKHLKDAKSLFFVNQSLGFYRYFCGKFKAAKSWAEKSLQYAEADKFAFGEILASDLLGLSYIRLGETNEGFYYLNQSIQKAKENKSPQFSAQTKISVLIFKLSFGLIEEFTQVDLDDFLKENKISDTYSQANLLLEYSNYLINKGQLFEAKQKLDSACKDIFKYKNRRFEIILNMRYAEIYVIEGEYFQALNLVKNAFRLINKKVDHHLKLKLLGMRLKISKLINLSDDEELELTGEVERLTQVTGEILSQRFLKRVNKEFPSHALPGEDPLGDLMDRVVQKDMSCLAELIDKKYFSLLPVLLDIKSRINIYINIDESIIIIQDKGQFTYIEKQLSPYQLKILMEISSNKKTKGDIIQSIWGFEYDPVIHDPLLYNNISKLRSVFSQYSSWIENNEGTYRLKKGISLVLISSEDTPVLVKKEIKLRRDEEFNLNYRQVLAMEDLTIRGAYCVRDYAEKFEVSKITANRDLTSLVQKGLLIKLGNARGTRYSRPNIIQEVV